MKIYTLRTLYRLQNYAIDKEFLFKMDSDEVVFISKRSYPEVNLENNEETQFRCIDNTYKGNPLLLEIVCYSAETESQEVFLIKKALELRTELIAAKIRWVLSGSVKNKISSALFFYKKEDPEKELTWYDVTPTKIQPGSKIDQEIVKKTRDFDAIIRNHDNKHQHTIETGLRWWMFGSNATSDLDSIVSFWIAIEVITSFLSNATKKEKRVKEAMSLVFSQTDSSNNRLICNKTSKLLADTRNSIVHKGITDIENSYDIRTLAEYVSRAMIQYLIDGTTSALLP